MKRRSLLAAGTATAALATLPRFAVAQGAGSRVLRYVPSANLTQLDPIWSTAYVTLCHGYAVFDTLYGTDAQGQVLPQMAAGHTVSDDGRRWTIRLREGLRFHDGAPVLARDCVASLQRWCLRQGAGQIIAGFLDRWEAPDDRTIVAHLKEPMPTLATLMAMSVFPPFVMPERLARTDPGQQVAEMVGSGPFRFKADEYVSGALSVYDKFAGYVPRQEAPDWTSGGKVARLDRIEWRVIPDSATAVAALQQGEVDWVEKPLADLVPMLKRRNDIVLDVIDTTGWAGALRFNVLHPPFDNEAIRRAVLQAVDQHPFLQVATAGDESSFTICHSAFPCGTPAGRPIPGTMPGDAQAARIAIAAAGYKGEPVVLLAPSDNPPLGDFAELAADVMRRIGLKVDVVSTDWGTVVQRRGKKEPVAQGGWSAFVTVVNGPAIMSPPVNFMIRGQGARGYFGWYENAEVEALVQQWLRAASDAERVAISDRIQAVVMRTAPLVPLGQYVQRTAYRNTIQGVLKGPATLPWNVRKA